MRPSSRRNGILYRGPLIWAVGLLWALGMDATSARPLQQVLNEGTLRVGVTLATPWAVRKANGELTGFEIDVASQLASDMGVDVEFRTFDWERLIRALEANEIDLIAAGLAITPERALHANFSRPYAHSSINLALQRERAAAITSIVELDAPEIRIAVVGGSVAEELLRRALARATRVPYPSADDASAALLAGEADALLAEEPVPTYLALEYPSRVATPLPQALLESPTAFAVNKGDPDFLAFLDAWITAREADTWLPTIHAYWFESLNWRRTLGDAAR
jgi:polar amino acid transport system substrate-binding protein